MSKLDPELLIEQIKKFFQDNLPAVVDAINAEKLALDANTFSIPNVASENYHNTMNLDLMNSDQFIYYGIGDMAPSADDSPIQDSYELSIFMTIVIQHNNEDYSENAKMIRYVRALSEVATKYMNQNSGSSLPRIQTIVPTPIAENENTDTFNIGAGILFQTSLA